MDLNAKQIISIVGAILSVLMISTTQLTDLLGAGMAKSIVSVAGLVNMILASVMAAITSQGATVQSVLNMQGVEKISVNDKANTMLANMAIDPTVDKIAPTQAAMLQVAATAKG